MKEPYFISTLSNKANYMILQNNLGSSDMGMVVFEIGRKLLGSAKEVRKAGLEGVELLASQNPDIVIECIHEYIREQKEGPMEPQEDQNETILRKV